MKFDDEEFNQYQEVKQGYSRKAARASLFENEYNGQQRNKHNRSKHRSRSFRVMAREVDKEFA